MILFENQLKTPGKKYKLDINCLATRRLSAIEWLTLTCVNKFHASEHMCRKTLKNVFEDVFQIQDGDLLIDPCINELLKLDVIEMDNPDLFNYGITPLAEMNLTVLGEKMLADGMLPGEPRDFPVTVFFNPLTGTVHNSDSTVSKSSSAITLGKAEDYDIPYPEKDIVDGLQSGSVGSGRFVASQNLIKGTTVIEETDRDCYTSLTVNLDDHGLLTTTPAIVNEKAKKNLIRLFYDNNLNQELTDVLPNLDTIEVSKIIGSGVRINESVVSILRNGIFIFMDYALYKVYEHKKDLFKNKKIILFNAPEFLLEVSAPEDNMVLIYVPEPFEVIGCVAINDSNENISLCKTTCIYDEKQLTIPLAVNDSRLRRRNTTAIKWFNSVVDKFAEADISFYGFASLPFLHGYADKKVRALLSRWQSKDINDIVTEIEGIVAVTDALGFVFLDWNNIGSFLAQKMKSLNYDELLSNVGKLIDLGVLRIGSNSYDVLIADVLNSYPTVESFADLDYIRSSFRLDDRDKALKYDALFGRLYNQNVLLDLVSRIVSGEYEDVAELFEYDTFFNDYHRSICQIELLVSGLKMFEHMEPEKLRESVHNCPDIAKLQYNISQISEKNSELIEDGINIFDAIKKIDINKADAYYSNIHGMLRFADEAINGFVADAKDLKQGETTITDAPVINQSPRLGNQLKDKAVFVIDTCAMIHKPELFLYFAADEYIRIPAKVHEELGKIKDRYYSGNPRFSGYEENSASTVARMLTNKLENIYLDVFNRYNPALLIVENADLSLLPPDLDKKVPDNMILSVALKYKEWNVHLISDDNQFRTMAKSQGIDAISSDDFIQSHEAYYVDEIKLDGKYKSAATRIIKEEKIKEKIQAVTKESGKADLSTILSTMKLGMLKQFLPDLNDKVISYLGNNKVKTVADFSILTEEQIDGFGTSSKDQVMKNGVKALLPKRDEAIKKIKDKYSI